MARDDPLETGSPAELMAFHARHKMDLLAREPEGAAELGRLAAQARATGFEEARARYAARFREVMAREPTSGGDVNALQHLLGHVRDREAARDLARRIEDHRAGRLALAEVKRALRERLDAEGARWAAEQTYLA